MNDYITAKATGSKRSQFIASIRKAVRYVDDGGSTAEAMKNVKQALKVLDKGE